MKSFHSPQRADLLPRDDHKTSPLEEHYKERIQKLVTERKLQGKEEILVSNQTRQSGKKSNIGNEKHSCLRRYTEICQETKNLSG